MDGRLDEGRLVRENLGCGDTIRESRGDEVGSRHKVVLLLASLPSPALLLLLAGLLSEAAAEAKAQTLYSRLQDGEDFGEMARNESDDLGSATGGGDLDWSGPGTFVGPFEAQLARMQPGERSPPIKTQFGWHIIELLDTRQEDKTEEARINEAAGQIRVRKAQEESESWLLRMRDEAFVDIRL